VVLAILGYGDTDAVDQERCKFLGRRDAMRTISFDKEQSDLGVLIQWYFQGFQQLADADEIAVQASLHLPMVFRLLRRLASGKTLYTLYILYRPLCCRGCRG
jgi:hypothetical protein